MSRMQRVGVNELPGHLNATYGIKVTRIEELDLGVYRVDRHEGASWVARLFPAERPIEQTLGDAAILRFLAELDYPAERCATAEPVSILEGQSLLVTELVPGVPRTDRRVAIRNAGGLAMLGWLLGYLHSLPITREAPRRPGGSWHHLADGAPRNEIAALRKLLDEAKHRADPSGADLYLTLAEKVSSLDDGDGLPESLVHPDFVLANVVAAPDPAMVLVDWAGSGRGPRLSALAFLLWAEGGKDLRRVDLALSGYSKYVTPERTEIARLEAAITARPLVLDIWRLRHRGFGAADAAASAANHRRLAGEITARVRSFG